MRRPGCSSAPIAPRSQAAFRQLDQVHPHFQCAFCNATNDVALDDYIQVTFTVSNGVRDIIFRHPEMLSVEDFYLRYNFSKGFIAPHGMTHQQLVAALSRGFADIEGHEHRSFDFEVTAGRFEVLDLKHKLPLVFFLNGQPAELQGTLVHSSPAASLCRTGPRHRETSSLATDAFRSGRRPISAPSKHTVRVENRTGDRGRFRFVQYPFGFTPRLVEYEPFFPASGCCSPRASANSTRRSWWMRARANVSEMTFLFIDLKQSTPLYESVGDVNAYFLFVSTSRS
jgi:hypothetical protein